MACSSCGPMTRELRNELAQVVYEQIVATMPLGSAMSGALRKTVVDGTAAALRAEFANWKVSDTAEFSLEKGGVKLAPAYAGDFLGDIYGSTLRDQMINDFSSELAHVLALTPDGTTVTSDIFYEVAQTGVSAVDNSTVRFECRFNPRTGRREWYDGHASRWTGQAC